MPGPPPQLPLVDLLIALLIGALVGIEREKKKAADGERGTAGLRTFILVAEAGAVAAWLSRAVASPWVFVLTGVLVGAAVLTGYALQLRAGAAGAGLTTEVAAIVVYLLGGLVLLGNRQLAVALAIATSAVLAYKRPLHRAVELLGEEDIYAGLKLLIATFIVLPVLPDRAVDPWGALNPYRLWLLVILISGLSLVGYAASRWLGASRGIPITGVAGGLVSSTAVTLSFARRSREPDTGSLDGTLAAGLLGAWAVMFVRVLVIAGVVYPPFAWSLSAPMLGLGVLCAGLAAVNLRHARRPSDGVTEVALRNPFSLRAALQFALLFAVVLLAVKLMQTFQPGRGVYLVAALAGLPDVDAITLSMAEQVRGDMSLTTAMRAVLVGAAANTLLKAALVAGLGTAALRRRVLGATALLLLAAAGLWLIG
jgi:uncharacterized membrane protein (DUF4010 family)